MKIRGFDRSGLFQTQGGKCAFAQGLSTEQGQERGKVSGRLGMAPFWLCLEGNETQCRLFDGASASVQPPAASCV